MKKKKLIKSTALYAVLVTMIFCLSGCGPTDKEYNAGRKKYRLLQEKKMSENIELPSSDSQEFFDETRAYKKKIDGYVRGFMMLDEAWFEFHDVDHRTEITKMKKFVMRAEDDIRSATQKGESKAIEDSLLENYRNALVNYSMTRRFSAIGALFLGKRYLGVQKRLPNRPTLFPSVYNYFDYPLFEKRVNRTIRRRSMFMFTSFNKYSRLANYMPIESLKTELSDLGEKIISSPAYKLYKAGDRELITDIQELDLEKLWGQYKKAFIGVHLREKYFECTLGDAAKNSIFLFTRAIVLLFLIIITYRWDKISSEPKWIKDIRKAKGMEFFYPFYKKGWDDKKIYKIMRTIFLLVRFWLFLMLSYLLFVWLLNLLNFLGIPHGVVIFITIIIVVIYFMIRGR